MGSLNSPRRTFYWSSIETIALDCFVFVKIAYFVCILATDKRTNGQTDGQTLLLLLLLLLLLFFFNFIFIYYLLLLLLLLFLLLLLLW